MKNTTLCYIEKNNKYLMLKRDKKKNDLNEGKWIGIGGHFEEGESPEECLLREVYEETGIHLKSYNLRGIVTFISDKCETEYMHLFTSDNFTGELHQCDEGTLKWIDKNDVLNLNIWEGDKIFLKLILTEHKFFSLKLVYKGDKLIENKLIEY